MDDASASKYLRGKKWEEHVRPFIFGDAWSVRDQTRLDTTEENCTKKSEKNHRDVWLWKSILGLFYTEEFSATYQGKSQKSRLMSKCVRRGNSRWEEAEEEPDSLRYPQGIHADGCDSQPIIITSFYLLPTRVSRKNETDGEETERGCECVCSACWIRILV